ncbi:MAG: hypothetical protein NC924_01050 [Candidatus Omnitrophica bacterium]|nr:hypothetical protein [Candidatus Omnitrophota bacterium]
MSENKFLRTAVVIFKVLAWISAAFFLIVSLVVFFGAGGPDTPRIAGIAFLLGGAFYFFFLFSVAETLRLLLHIAGTVKKIDSLLDGSGSQT